MSKFDIQKAREFVQKKERKRRQENHKLFKKAWDDFDLIKEILIKKYNPKRVYQWGSLLNERDFSEISDIDIAVEGVKSAEEFFEMFGAADKLTNFPLDLVEIEKIEPIHARSIREKGRLVYERK